MVFLSVFTPLIEELARIDWWWIAFFLFLALGVSFLCSLLEAIILSVTWSHIEILGKNDKDSGTRLKRLKNNIDQPLAAILTWNTIAHTIGAAGVGSEFHELGNLWFTTA